MNSLIQMMAGCLLAAFACAGISQSLNDSVELTVDLQKQAVQSQQSINKIVNDTNAMLEEYRRLLLDADYHQVYLNQLTQELHQQQLERESLQLQIERIQLTEKRLAPLLASMVQTLERFVVLDLPFQQQERIDAVLLLRERLHNSQLPLVDRFQLVMEVFQVELEYGHTLEAYREKIDWQGQKRSVDCLRVGRLALYFMTPDGAEVGYWNRQEKQWLPLSSEYSRVIREGVAVAKSQQAPKLLTLPVMAGVAP